MKNSTIRDKYLLVPASVLVLSMGCAAPVAPTDDTSLDDVDADTSEELDEAFLAWESGEDEKADWKEIPMDINVQSAPSTAVVRDTPHMAFVGNDNRCFLSSYGRSGWRSPRAIPGCVGPAAPTLAAHGNILNVGYVGTGGSCYVNAYDGYNWAQPVGIGGCGGSFAPVVAPYGGALNVVYGGLGGGLYHTTCLGGFRGCGLGTLIPGVSTVLQPALLGWGSGLTLAYTGLNRQLYYSTYGGWPGGGWGYPIGIPGAFAAYGPALGYYGGYPFLGYRSLHGGFGFHPYLGAGLGWGRFYGLGSPFLRGPLGVGRFGFGHFGLGRHGFGAFAPFGGRMFFRGFPGIGRGFGWGHPGLGGVGWGRGRLGRW